MANGLILCAMNAPQKILNFFYLKDFGLLYTFIFALIPNFLVAQGLVATNTVMVILFDRSLTLLETNPW